MAVAKINEALDTGDPNETLQALQTPAAKLREVEPDLYILYLITLRGEKDHKAEVSSWLLVCFIFVLFLFFYQIINHKGNVLGRHEMLLV